MCNDDKNPMRKLDYKEHREYRRICGAFNWVSSQTRADIAYDTGRLAHFAQNPTVKEAKAASKVLRKLKSRELKINMHKIEEPFTLIAYADASYANLMNNFVLKVSFFWSVNHML